jgi:hypothetical protein
MPDERHATLVKAAEECIDLMNIGVEPNAALRKVAQDFGMTDKETTLVSHAVNNSKQLAHLQTAKEEDREKPFVLTNACSVSGADSEAKIDTVANPAKEKQPDAVEIADKVKSAAASYVETCNFRVVPTNDVEATTAALRESWGLDKVGSTASPDYDDSNPYHAVNQLKIASDQASMEALRRRDNACALIDDVASQFIRTNGPNFAEFEKAAHVQGITEDIVELIYQQGPAGLGLPRFDKTAAVEGRLYVSPVVMELLKQAEEIDTLWQSSADYMAAQSVLNDQIRDYEMKLAESPAVALDILENVTKSTRDTGGSIGELGLGQDPVGLLGEASGVTVKSEKGDADISQAVRQQRENARSKDKVESLMADPYISKHPVPEIIDAYNRALSVNSDFGDAEIAAFVKQDLASKGAVPLDLMVRASQSHKKAPAFKAE